MTTTERPLVVAGGSGFVGTAICASASAGQAAHRQVRAARIHDLGGDPLAAAASWMDAHRDVVSSLVGDLDGAQVAVNAAGLARPGGPDHPELRGANVLWPVVLLRCSAAAGVRRVVHISSAAVQGRRSPLDESMEHEPFSPYSRSKAAGEVALRHAAEELDGRVELTIYRPTSVHGAARAATRSLISLSQRRWVPVSGDGDQPLPITLIEDVARAALLLALTPSEVPPVALHPWEGMTTGLLLRALAPEVDHIRARPRVVGPALAASRLAGRVSPRLAAANRKAELLLQGQEVDARALRRLGFEVDLGLDRWRRLASATRA